jgi:hypothetical protein
MEQVTETPQKKNKSPGRVAWGKKLAEISRQQRALKKQQAIPDMPVAEPEPCAPRAEPTKSHTQLWIAIGGLLVGVGALYYQRKMANQPDESQDEPPKCAPAPAPKPTKMVEMA